MEKFIESIHFTLKDNGLFVLAVPNNEGFISEIPNYLFNMPPHHSILWIEKSLRFMANKFNFDVVQVKREPLQDVHKEIAYLSYVTSKIRKLLFSVTTLLTETGNPILSSRLANRLLRTPVLKSLLYRIAGMMQKEGQSIIMVLRKRKTI